MLQSAKSVTVGVYVGVAFDVKGFRARCWCFIFYRGQNDARYSEAVAAACQCDTIQKVPHAGVAALHQARQQPMQPPRQ
jgi:hypothetical protein